MDNSILDPLKERYDYKEWYGRNTLDESLLIWNYTFTGDEFSDWKLSRSQEIQTPGWPPAIQTLWQSVKEEAGALMSITLYQAGARSEAHEFLVQLLGEFQFPNLARLEPGQPGDVAFTPPGETTALFARANLVILMQNGGADIVPMVPLAIRLDKILSRCPEPVEKQVKPKIQHFSSPTEDLKSGVAVPLDFEVVDPLGRPIWYMIFSSSGEFRLESGKLEYLPTRVGSHRLRLCAINPNRGAAQEELTINVE